jgi:hypothetical protein
MTDENLAEFLNDRVLPTRQVHHIDYPLDTQDPAVGVMIDCPQDATTAVILPTFARGVLHLEIHLFGDGERVNPSIRKAEQDGCIELTLRKPKLTI